MPSIVVQFRVDEELKNEASKVYEEIGIDLSSALRTFLKRSVKEKGFPFEMNIDQKRKDDASKLLSLFEQDAIKNGTNNMTLDEINYEIKAARRDRRR